MKFTCLYIILLFWVSYAQLDSVERIINIEELNQQRQEYVQNMIRNWNKCISRRDYFQKLKGLEKKIFVIESGTLSSSNNYNISTVLDIQGRLANVNGLQKKCKKLKIKKTKKSFEDWRKSIFVFEHDFDIKGGAVLLITIITPGSNDSTYVKYGF
jgi:hypothetical protein